MAGGLLRGKRSLYARLPRPLRVAATFLLVGVSWVFFRSRDLSEALRYLGSMAGYPTHLGSELLLSGLIYQPYYLATVAIAVAIAFAAPQTWDWTRRLPLWKALICALALWLALVMLETQAFNPFIYFIF